MAKDDDEWKLKIGRLQEEEEDPLFSGRRTISSTSLSISLATHRTVKLRWSNIPRGREGTSTFARRSGWTDYPDRTGRFSKRNDLLGTCGDDRKLFADAVNAIKDRARRYNDAVMLTGFFPLPRELSLAGQMKVVQLICDDVRATGRLCCGSLHAAPVLRRGNQHFHIRATARPVRLEGSHWHVSKGKFIDGREQLIEWRRRFCALVNAQIDDEGLAYDQCRRFYHGPLSKLTGDRPAKRWVSQRAALRDDPDLSRPEDQFNIVWNACIDRGLDPNQNSFVKEKRAEWAAAREKRRAEREAQRIAKQARRQERFDRQPGVQALRTEIERLRKLPIQNILPPLSEDYAREVERAHKKDGKELPQDWQDSEFKRGQAEAVRADVTRREATARKRAEMRAAKRAADQAQALLRVQEEERDRNRRFAEENARQAAKKAAKAAAEQASKAAQEEERRRLIEARNQGRIEAAVRIVIPDARSIPAYVNAAKGILRASGSDDMAEEYDGARGKVARASHVREFLSWQQDPALRWIYNATILAAEARNLPQDERDVLGFARDHLEREIRARGHDLEKFRMVLHSSPPAAPARHGGKPRPPEQQAPAKPERKRFWPWAKKPQNERS